jgi:hypothetical protein
MDGGQVGFGQRWDRKELARKKISAQSMELHEA